MIARIHESMRKEDKGFTLVELLVVIVIIGILIAIAIPAFLKFRENGWKKQAQSDARNIATAAEGYATDNNGSYANLTATAANPGDPVTGTLSTYFNNMSDGVSIGAFVATASEFCVITEHESLSGTQFKWSSDSGKIEEGSGLTC